MSNNNKQNPNQSKSMFLYTALIFAVALILIILAFFGQTNLSALRKSTEQLPEITEQVIETTEAVEEKTASPDNEAIAKMTNTISALNTENSQLKNIVTTYDNLLEANSYISKGDKENADVILSSIDESALTENQKILYDQIKNQINE
ncbi:MAG: hypothetical protein ACI4EA_11520 [Candidatus Ornithomonoglobus sp.]